MSGGAIKHSLAMMDVRVGVSGRTLVEAECGCVSEEFSGWFWVFCTGCVRWSICVFLINSNTTAINICGVICKSGGCEVLVVTKYIDH